MVGRMMCRVLEERNLPIKEFIPVASERSVGKPVVFDGREYAVVSVEQALSLRPDVVLFSAGAATARQWAPRFAELGAYVIDNSSAFRMDEGIPLVVPEINADSIDSEQRIIANPNCSTIQMVMVLAPIHRAYGIERIVVSTYQSVTGTGARAVRQYEQELAGAAAEQPAYPHPIFGNCLPHCDVFLDNGYTREEMKMVNETRKILNDYSLRITATAVRVPVLGGHSESVNLSLQKDFDLNAVRALLAAVPGVMLVDDPAANRYPMPLTAQGRDEVFVGRLRRDESQDRGLNLWIVADNLRKGAATNAVQIVGYLLNAGKLKA